MISVVPHGLTTTCHSRHYFIQVDVSSYASQLAMFKKAIELSPNKHLDVVAANAGIGESERKFMSFEPDSTTVDVPVNNATTDIDLTGVIYTTRLAYWAFALPPPKGSKFADESPRHHSLLLTGSMASIQFSFEPLYAAAKHGVLGMFRALRRPNAFTGIDANNPKLPDGRKIKIKLGLLCPFYVATRIILVDGVKIVPDSLELTQIDDVVEAASRLILDKEGGKAAVVTTAEKAKSMSKGKNKGGIYELQRLDSRL